MKAKLNFTLIIVLLFFSTLGYAQEQRFIEVMASDTITLKATGFVYKISIGEQMEYMGIKIPSDNTSTEPLPEISEITKMLDKGNFNYSIAENDYSISKTETQPDILVRLNNNAELKKLYELLKPQKGISGKIKEVFYEPISKYYDVLYKKLYSNAMTQASQWAAISGNSIGQLISISYVKNEPENYMDYYKTLMKDLTPGLTDNTDKAWKREEIKMIFKFGLK